MFSPAGSGSERGNREGTREYRNCQFMTPETRRTTHFFFVYLNNFEGSDGNVSRSLLGSLIEGFMEDKHIIEHQQTVLDKDADYRMQAIAADAALSHFRLTLSKLIAREREEEARRAPPEREPLRPHELLLR
jgi:vanillate O-demethylase monooxygenase subunit